jgi:hypothetical protein
MRIEQWYARGLWLLLVPGLCLTTITSLAQAEAGADVAPARQRLAAFKTSVVQTDLADLGSAVDLLLRDQLDTLRTVSVVSQPALDLPSLQLVLDCAGETPACLAQVAERTQADILLGPTLTRTDHAIVMSLMLYDQGRSSPLEVVTRRFALSAGDDAVLNGVSELLHDLFGISPRPPDAGPAQPPGVQPTPAVVAPPPSAAVAREPRKPVAASTPSLLLPLALGAAGVACIGAGVGFGLSADSSQAEYAKHVVATNQDAKRALELYHRADTHATLANIGFGVGAAAIAAGALVFILQRTGAPQRERPAPSSAARLQVGLGQLTVSGAWN